jgi:hypothetical protein
MASYWMSLTPYLKLQNKLVVINQVLQKYAEVNGKAVVAFEGRLSKIIKPISLKIWVLFFLNIKHNEILIIDNKN